MEIAIKELEVENGLEAPRTGGVARLKSKILGKCQVHLHDLYSIILY